MYTSITGILGGMGPLASAAFVHFLYQKCRSQFSEEQSYPRIILISDPTIPDRMACVETNTTEKIVAVFDSEIQKLLLLGADRVLICCFTAHYFLKLLPPERQKSIINLSELLKSYLDERQKNTLILCSELLAKSNLIDSAYAIYPEKRYFEKIHQLIYQIKLNGSVSYKEEMLSLIQSLAKAHNVSEVLLTCTEFHLIYQDIPVGLQDASVRILKSDGYIGLTSINAGEIHILDGLNIAADFILSKR